MTQPKKTKTRSAKSAPKADFIDLAAEPVTEGTEIVQAEKHTPALKPYAPAKAKLKESELFTFSLRDQSEAIRQVMREVVVASSQGALEVNGKIILALQSQSHAAIDLWRTAIDNSRLPDGFNAQASAAHQIFETTSAQWKDVAETTARWMAKSLEPLQSAFLQQAR